MSCCVSVCYSLFLMQTYTAIRVLCNQISKDFMTAKPLFKLQKPFIHKGFSHFSPLYPTAVFNTLVYISITFLSAFTT